MALGNLCQGIKGANYVPSYARNTVEIWDRYDQTFVERELGYVKNMGLNSVRIFLNYRVYAKDKNSILKRIDNFLFLCEQNELTAMLVLFDACMEFSNPQEMAKDLCKDKEWKNFFEKWSKALGLGKRVDKLVNLWTPNPGFKYLGKEFWKEYEQYVKDITRAHQGDSRIVCYDIMNEPDVYFDVLGRKEPYLRFVEHFCQYVKSLQDEIPITVGIAFHDPESISFFHSWEDILSFHAYEPNPQKLRKLIGTIKDRSKEYQKPFIVSEWGNSTHSSFKAATDQGQLEYYQTIMPLVEEAKISWYFWELMAGNDPFAYQGIFYPNGQRRPAGSFIEEFLQAGKPRTRVE